MRTHWTISGFLASLFPCLLFAQETLSVVDSAEYRPQALTGGLNTRYEEYLPIISADGNTLYFSRKLHPRNIGDAKAGDIWFATKQPDGTWAEPRREDPPVNNRFSNGVLSVTPDGNRLLLVNQYLPNDTFAIGASIAERQPDGSWAEPRPVVIRNLVNENQYAAYFLSNSARELISAVQGKDSYGDQDLYVSFLQEDSTYSEPINLGAVVNTPGAEFAPFLASDGVTLYFASMGHEGLGDADIFVTRRLDDSWRNWSAPENLGPAINTPGFDAYYSISAAGDFAYFTREKEGAGTDLFRVRLPDNTKPNPVALVNGRIRSSKDSTAVRALVFFSILPEYQEQGFATSNASDGKFGLTLPAGHEYLLVAEARGFLSFNQTIDLKDLTEYKEMDLEIVMEPVEVGQTFRLNNIFFETASAILKPESYNELNRVVEFLRTNRTISIEIGGHTDNVGADDLNQRLSEGRANAVRSYLLQKGIQPDRVTALGYGETKPVDTNETDAGKAKNRRVEFRVLTL